MITWPPAGLYSGTREKKMFFWKVEIRTLSSAVFFRYATSSPRKEPMAKVDDLSRVLTFLAKCLRHDPMPAFIFMLRRRAAAFMSVMMRWLSVVGDENLERSVAEAFPRVALGFTSLWHCIPARSSRGEISSGPFTQRPCVVTTASADSRVTGVGLLGARGPRVAGLVPRGLPGHAWV